VTAAVSQPYANLLAEGTGDKPLGKRFVDDSKVTDHHAIIPTGKAPGSLDLRSDEGKIYDLVCRRLLGAWHDDHILAVTNVVTAVDAGDEGKPDRFHSSGTAVEQEGENGFTTLTSRRCGQGHTSMDKHYHWDEHDLILRLRISPRASRDQIGSLMGVRLKISITAPPVDGKANSHLLKCLAQQFGVSTSHVTLERGPSGRDKTVRVRNPKRLPAEFQLT